MHDNTIWYFPCGKIDDGESPLQTIIRKLNEELNIQVQQPDLVVTDNHDRTDTVSIHCYAGENHSTNYTICGNISDKMV